jgi:hypothetical protein
LEPRGRSRVGIGDSFSQERRMARGFLQVLAFGAEAWSLDARRGSTHRA